MLRGVPPVCGLPLTWGLRFFAVPLEQAFQRNGEDAEPPGQWQPADRWDAAQNREYKNNFVLRALVAACVEWPPLTTTY